MYYKPIYNFYPSDSSLYYYIVYISYFTYYKKANEIIHSTTVQYHLFQLSAKLLKCVE